ncbi:hypothetical protein SAMN05216319_0329 [Duganella sp. CF402]|uniref:DUF6624 domain-containing protein n=1 Tax=unclassified Duganella TaxID=2636909 RepID=UPI0008ACF70D|nr:MULTISPECIES: DUF6624 domain-containing protein [unclassified Duganella]RZT11192.1 hypothetical protein EV582_3297 [Duganella sp. BK701]SEK76980.1 hypothetical protein SAMN05216319_0329 [Duganella sp. CF402]
MIFRRQFFLLAALACSVQRAYADDGLTQTTISFYANGKAVGGIIFAIGAKTEAAAKANQIDQDAQGIHLVGNVQASLTPQSLQSFILLGDDVRVIKTPITPDRAKAVRDLEAMSGPDQLYRGRAASANVTSDEWAQQSAIDTANMKRLAEIIDAYGWPGLHFAGMASQTAFLVLQHADKDSQLKYLPLLRDAVKRADALGSDLALLEDRVRISDGRAQLYGTQLIGEPLRFAPIEDEQHVDERRRSIGLPPLAEYAKLFGVTYRATESNPN